MALQLAGDNGLLQPVLEPTNPLIVDLHNTMVGTAEQVGIPEIMQAVVKLGINRAVNDR